MPKLKKLAAKVATVAGVAPSEEHDNNYMLQSVTPGGQDAQKTTANKAITIEQVTEHYYKLLEAGINPSLRAIRTSLGNRGSFSTIGKFVTIVDQEHQKALKIKLDQTTNRLDFVEVLMREMCNLVYGSKVDVFEEKVRILQETLAETSRNAIDEQKALGEDLDKLNEELSKSHQALDAAIAEKEALATKNAELLNTIAELKNELKETKAQLKQCKDIQTLLNKLSSDPEFAKEALKGVKKQ